MLTSAEADELLAAKTPLPFWRKKRDLTQAALADAAGISQAFRDRERPEAGHRRDLEKDRRRAADHG
jgi:transcriptional regulator with XRE-family HTH domain